MLNTCRSESRSIEFKSTRRGFLLIDLCSKPEEKIFHWQPKTKGGFRGLIPVKEKAEIASAHASSSLKANPLSEGSSRLCVPID
jgi:hypothetical protein